MIATIWLALSSVIYSRVTRFFALNNICSKSRHSCSKLHYSCFKSHHFSPLLHHFCFGYKVRWISPLFPLFNKLATRSNKYWYWLLEFCDFKMVVIKWWLNWVSFNFVLNHSTISNGNHVYDFRLNTSITIINVTLYNIKITYNWLSSQTKYMPRFF